MLEESVEARFDEMLDSFVPGEDPGDAPFATLLNGITQGGCRETDMCSALVDAINEAGILQGRFIFVATEGYHDVARRDTRQSIDGGMYPTSCAPTSRSQADWSTIELSLVCKVESQDDPFDNKQPRSDERRSVLEQSLSCGTLVFDRQHRTHYYTIFVFDTLARVVRLDRAGTIFSEKFDYTKEPAKLARFLWRFSRLPAIQRGHDPTASRVLPGTPDYDLMMACASTPRPTGDYARVLFQESLADDWPWWRITVEDADGPRDFLVGKPSFIASGLVGRGTRGYLALDPCDPDHPVVFLKDCWRIVHEQTETEGAILSYLNGCGVTGIPTRLCDGDVGEQETVSQDVWKAKHVGEECRLRHHRHYRLVVKEVGIPLREFKNGRQLVSIILDCLEAHEDAYLKAGLIHRDISCGNLLMLPRENPSAETVYEGLLVDWELSKRMDPESETPGDPDRRGTWQFMSINALNNLNKPILISDELESFFHVLLWFAIRWLPHNCGNVSYFMRDYFDAGETANRKDYYCGVVKQSTITGAHLFTSTNAPLHFLRRPPPTQISEGRSARSPTSSDHSNRVKAPPVSVEALKWAEADLHPIDALFTELLRWFSAYYQLPKLPKNIPPPILHLKKPTNARDCRRLEQYQQMRASDSHWHSTSVVESHKQYRAAVERCAKKLESHKAMAELLFEWLYAAEDWPEDDKQPDHLVPNSDQEDSEKDDETEEEPVVGSSSKRGALHEGPFSEYAAPRPHRRHDS